MKILKNFTTGLLLATYMLTATPQRVNASEGGSSGAGGFFYCKQYTSIISTISTALLEFSDQDLQDVDVNLNLDNIKAVNKKITCLPNENRSGRRNNQSSSQKQSQLLDQNILKTVLISKYNDRDDEILTLINEKLWEKISEEERFDLSLYEFFSLLTINKAKQYVDSAKVVSFLNTKSKYFNDYLLKTYQFSKVDVAAYLIHRNTETAKFRNYIIDTKRKECDEYTNIVLKYAKMFEDLEQSELITMSPNLTKDKIKNLKLRFNCILVKNTFKNPVPKNTNRDLWSSYNEAQDTYETQLKKDVWNEKSIRQKYQMTLHEIFVLLNLEKDGQYQLSNSADRILPWPQTPIEQKLLYQTDGIYKLSQEVEDNGHMKKVEVTVLKNPKFLKNETFYPFGSFFETNKERTINKCVG